MPTELKTKRRIIADLVVARLQTILVVNGYQTDVGKNVDYWRTGTFSEEEMSGKPDGALGVRDVDEIKFVDGVETKVNKLPTEKFLRDLRIQIELVRGGTQSPTDVHKMIADIETAIGKDVRWKDGDGKARAVGTRPHSDRSVVEQNSLKITGVLYEFYIVYTTGAFNPYQ